MKQYQVRSTFISKKGILGLYILLLANTVMAAIFLIGPFQNKWLSLIISFYLLILLVVIFIDSRTVKLFKVSKEKIILGSKVVNPEELLRITITHNQIELTRAEAVIFRKVLIIRMVNLEEFKSITKELLEIAIEHGIRIENQS